MTKNEIKGVFLFILVGASAFFMYKLQHDLAFVAVLALLVGALLPNALKLFLDKSTKV
jgi:uncharacterized membrane protein